MIILEGCDLAGKSTLAEALFTRVHDVTGYAPMVRHFTKPKPSFDKYWGYKNCIQRDVILDRFHLSHIVYRAIDSENHDLTPFKYELIDAEISRVGGVIVCFALEDEVIIRRWNAMPNDRQEMYTLKQVLQVNQVYRQIHANGFVATRYGTYRPKIDYFITKGVDVLNVCNDIIDLWQKRQEELVDVIDDKPCSL